ncbi:cupin domain-containing protein [Paenibacillus nanensis]|uniref:Cupin domain-containing protein n=1 Tax=Paenibacillus nanensis TaxID=393251 RepID=A0A3A1V1L7_9BACL|nr:cupin domain-containing protein [Paenibacillus nanensis]RIX53701.1 cupin domain-containing protein [Paenibacillus nanensis]
MISKKNAEHYVWGQQCDGWRLVNEAGQSIIHERMPAGTSEMRHYHVFAKQFFFVLSGVMTIEVNGELHTLSMHEGIEVKAKQPHQVFNRSNEEIEFLVISQPNTKGDRIAVE